jgi:hypothetical protein
VRLAVPEHPANVYVTVYVVLVPGETVIEDVVAPPGAHEYEPPPADGVAVSVTEVPAQTGAGELIETVGTGFTVILCVTAALHPPDPTVYVTGMLPDKPEGLNVLPETPDPLQVPPVVPVIYEFKFIEAALAHIAAGVVQAALLGFVTVIDWQ